MKLAPATGSTEVTMNQYFENTLTAIHSSFSKLSMKLSDKLFFFLISFDGSNNPQNPKKRLYVLLYLVYFKLRDMNTLFSQNE